MWHALLSQIQEEEKRPDALVAIDERVVFDDEVEQMSGLLLARRVERLPEHGLLDAA